MCVWVGGVGGGVGRKVTDIAGGAKGWWHTSLLSCTHSLALAPHLVGSIALTAVCLGWVLRGLFSCRWG